MQKMRLYSARWIYVIALCLVFLCAAFIFKMSHESSETSSNRSSIIADKVAESAVKNFDSKTQPEKISTTLKIEHILRKTAHFCIYTAFGALLAFASLWHSRTWIAHGLIALLIGTLYAASDELHQSFIPGRGPLFTDVILDSAGVLCGALVMLAFAGVWLRRKS